VALGSSWALGWLVDPAALIGAGTFAGVLAQTIFEERKHKLVEHLLKRFLPGIHRSVV